MKNTLEKKMRREIENAFHNRKLCMEDIVKIIEIARELYDLDGAFITTNREYKYQLNQVIVCDRGGTKTNISKSLMLTKEQYENLIKAYMEQPMMEKTVPVLEDEYRGSVLRCAIMQGEFYYGHVAFASEENREWTDEEKCTLSTLSHLLLVLFALNYLGEGLNRYIFESQKFQNETISSGFFLNIKSGKCHGIKLASFLERKVQEWEEYEKLLSVYTDSYVDPIYGQQIQDRFNLDNLKAELSMKKPIMSIDFPRVVDRKVNWYRYVIELIDIDEEGMPYKAYFYFRDITNEVQNKAYISGASEVNKNAYVVISSIDLDTEQYAVYVDNRDETVKDAGFYSYGGYRELIEKMAETAMDKNYAKQFKEFFSLENLREYFTNNQTVLKYEFPYVANDKSYWVKLEAVKTQHFSDNGKKIVLYYSDITDQKNRELQLQTVSQSLAKEHERVREAELQAMIDPLTGVYNRAGFECMIKQYREQNVPIGFVLVDIDNFKTINDTYGHEFGDEVLMLIAKRLQSSFRNEDNVFRMGGDEFALLLYGCGADACHSLQMKFANIHHFLKEKIKKDIIITLSAGFSQSEHGYLDTLITLSDEALYHTKREGRAGVTQISNEHQILYSWHDSKFQDRRNAISKVATIGKWRVEYNDTKERTKLFLDETAHIMLQIPNTLTPEECFLFWKERIVARHRELYMEMKAKIVKTGQAECVYHWAHPSKGEIAIRTGAKYCEDDKTKEIFGYIQELKDSDIVLSYDDGQFLMQAMNRIYFCTYYFNLNTKEYYILKGHENEKDVKERHEKIDVTFEKFVHDFVHPEYQQKVADFSNLSTLSERLKNLAYIDCEYLSKQIGWCRTRIMPVKWDELGNLTHAVSMSARINDAKKEEL